MHTYPPACVLETINLLSDQSLTLFKSIGFYVQIKHSSRRFNEGTIGIGRDD